MRTYLLQPQDVLFFRDGRPMEPGAGSGGHGASWPSPSVFSGALHAALHRAFEKPQSWERQHRFGLPRNRDLGRAANQRFGSLTTAGPFPVCTSDAGHHEWHFPVPADLVPDGDGVGCLLPLEGSPGKNNLPAPLSFPVANPCLPSKEELGQWLSREAFDSYLSGDITPEMRGVSNDSFFEGEHTTGIRVDPATLTQDKVNLYSAAYLRLKPQVHLGTLAHLPVGDTGQPEGLDRLIGGDGHIAVMGGQQRTCNIRSLEGTRGKLETVLPVGADLPAGSTRIKWVLLSPAVFPPIHSSDTCSRHAGGWLPNWVAPCHGFEIMDSNGKEPVAAGQVLLKKGDTARRPGESRHRWRRRVRSELPFFDCRLVAARIPKPIPISGWSDRIHLIKDEHAADVAVRGKAPNGTRLAVPAGAVYYFEGPDAADLADQLNWHGPNRVNISGIVHRRSTLFGEKGFGLGVCAPWKPYSSHENKN